MVPPLFMVQFFKECLNEKDTGFDWKCPERQERNVSVFMTHVSLLAEKFTEPQTSSPGNTVF